MAYKVQIEAEKLYTPDEELMQLELKDLFDDKPEATANSFNAKTGEKMENITYTGTLDTGFIQIQNLVKEIKKEIEDRLDHSYGLTVIVRIIDLDVWQEEARA